MFIFFGEYFKIFFLYLSLFVQSLSRQSSLVEDRIDDSDEDEFQEERSGRSRAASSTRSESRGRPVIVGGLVDDNEDTWSINRSKPQNSSSSGRAAFQHPDLLKDIIVMKLFKNSTERATLRRQKSEEISTALNERKLKVLKRQKSDDSQCSRTMMIVNARNMERCKPPSLSRNMSLNDVLVCGEKGRKATAGTMKTTKNGRSISRSLTSSEICEMQMPNDMTKDKRGKRSRLIKSCIAQ